jgi:hypothetical protein
MTINALKKLGDKGRKGIRISGENTFPVLESPVIISIGNNNEREIAELLTNSFDVKFGRLFIQPPLFRLVHQLLRVL